MFNDRDFYDFLSANWKILWWNQKVQWKILKPKSCSFPFLIFQIISTWIVDILYWILLQKFVITKFKMKSFQAFVQSLKKMQFIKIYIEPFGSWPSNRNSYYSDLLEDSRPQEKFNLIFRGKAFILSIVISKAPTIHYSEKKRISFYVRRSIEYIP